MFSSPDRWYNNRGASALPVPIALNAMIRIAHIVEATAGGVTRHVLDLVSHLDSREFTCVLYLSFQRPDSRREPWQAMSERGVILREVPMARVPNPLAVRQLIGWLRRDAVDLVHAHSAKAGYLGRLAADELGIPAIYTPHAFPFQRSTDWRRGLYRLVERRLAAITARIICVSATEAEEARVARLPAEKLAVIPNGLDLASWPSPTREERRRARRYFGIADTELVVGVIARLVPQKGIDLLLPAVVEVIADYPSARFLIWGDGPQRRKLQGMARRLGLCTVQFMGDTADPRTAYLAMDIFCAPSRWEGAPYAVLEAMACGLPVVASEVPGHLDDIVEESTGLLAPSYLPGPLAGALDKLLADEDVRLAYGQAGRRRVEAVFPLAPMVAATARLYRETTEPRFRIIDYGHGQK